MKKFLPFAIIVVVLAAAVGLSLVLLKGKGGTTNSNETFANNGPVAPGATPANQPSQASAGLTKPNVKVSSPVVMEEYGDYQCPPCGQLYPELWEMHDKLYRNQAQWAEAGDPLPVFIAYAKELGLKIDQFTSDLESNLIDQRISADIQRGTSMGVTGTPTVFLDSHLVRYEATNADGLRRGINILLEQKAGS